MKRNLNLTHRMVPLLPLVLLAMPVGTSAAPQTGSWEYVHVLDELTDDDRSYVYIEDPDDPDALLAFRCLEDGMNVLYVLGGVMIGDEGGSVQVRYRIDRGTLVDFHAWDLMDSQDIAWMPMDQVDDFRIAAESGESVVFEVLDPHDEEKRRNTFPLEGTARAVGLLACSGKLPSAPDSNEYAVGGHLIEVPRPAGYVPVTPDMTNLYRFVQRLGDQNHDLLAYYVRERVVGAALAGQIPDLDRYFALKVNKKFVDAVTSAREFSDLLAQAQKINTAAIERAKAQMPEQAENVSRGVSEEFEVDFRMDVTEMVPLAVHWASAHAFAYSMFIKFDISAEEEGGSRRLATSVGSANLNGKVLTFYVYGPEDDLEWTRTALRSWIESALDANERPPAEPVGRSTFDLDRMLRSSFVIGIIGGIVGLIIGVMRREKGKSDE